VTITIYCDGLVEPVNPGGYGCWGWVALSDEGELGRDYGCLGRANALSNNVAEYQAVLRALQHAARAGWKATNGQKLIVRTDSQLVVNQVNGQWACQANHLQPMRNEVRSLLTEIGGRLEWVARQQNQKADGLTRLAYAQALRLAGVEPKTRADMLRARKVYQQRRMPLKAGIIPPLPFQPNPEPSQNQNHQLQLPLF
jgi:ribonuclease HI